MNKLQEEIEKIEFKTESNFSFDLNRELGIISSYLNPKEEEFLKQDFDHFLEKGKFVIVNTFGGGILFLKEAEIIEKILIESNSKSKKINASVLYESETRKPENIKYKPEVGKTESTTWNANDIFPNFYKFEKTIQNVLILIIGKIVKQICEYGRTNFTYMKIVNEFNIELITDKKTESILKVELK